MHQVDWETVRVSKAMGGGEPRERVGQDTPRNPQRKPRPLLRREGQQLADVEAIDVVHHEETAALVLAELEQLHDVRMANGRRDAGFLHELLGTHAILKVGVEQLQGYRAWNAGHVRLGQVHGGHAAQPDAPLNRVVADALRHRVNGMGSRSRLLLLPGILS